MIYKGRAQTRVHSSSRVYQHDWKKYNTITFVADFIAWLSRRLSMAIANNLRVLTPDFLSGRTFSVPGFDRNAALAYNHSFLSLGELPSQAEEVHLAQKRQERQGRQFNEAMNVPYFHKENAY